ncbi:hypothetical protein CLOM_g20636 [Closterium sp. NIES-68]|nr:hypothetical protein CLOM_g20636 [Closterium sp. NIES-68]
MSIRALLVVILSLALVTSAPAAPTTEQIIKELKELQTKLSKRFKFIIMNQAVGQIITQGETVPGDIDWSPFFYNTVLLPTDYALKASGLLEQPTTPEAAIKLLTSISYNVIKGMWSFNKIKALRAGASVPLLLNNGKLFRRKVSTGFFFSQSTSVALALKGKPKGNWSSIVAKNLHKGGSFNVIGVNRLQTTG